MSMICMSAMEMTVLWMRNMTEASCLRGFIYPSMRGSIKPSMTMTYEEL